MARRIVVVGGGFAGVWAALGAARHLDRSGVGPDAVEVVLISADSWLTIRPRLYEAGLDGVRVPLDRLLGPAGVRRVEGRVTAIDTAGRTVTVGVGGRTVIRPYDRLVVAAGSSVQVPSLPGTAGAFTVDTYADARRLSGHLQSLPGGTGGTGGTSGTGGARRNPDAWRAVVVGAGFTGLEVATEMAGRLRRLAPSGAGTSVTLVDSSPEVGHDLGPSVREVVSQALSDLGIDLRMGETVSGVSPAGVTLASGDQLPAGTTIWAGGLRASPLVRTLGAPADRLGRMAVDPALRVAGATGVFAAGDVAAAMADEVHPALMSCQHAIPMGKFAGHNAAADLLGDEPLGYRQPDYVTCLDLGDAGAVFTRGWDRAVICTGEAGKRVKRQINRRDIYPPASGNRQELLEAARPYTPSMDGLVAFGASH